MAEHMKLLEMLDRIEVYKPSKDKEPFDRKLDRYSVRSLAAGCCFVLIVGILLVAHLTFGPLSDGWILFAKVCGLLGQLCSLLPLLAPLIMAIRFLLNCRKFFLRDLTREFKHDLSAIDRLTGFSSESLMYVQLWLETKVSRIDRRLGLFFGSKTAGVSLFLLIYGAIEKMGGYRLLSDFLNAGGHWTLSTFIQYIIVIVLAGVLGLSLGAIAMKWLASKYAYQAELVALTLRKKSANDPSV